MESLGEIHFSLSRILNKAWEIITEIYVEDKENTQSNIAQGSLWLVSWERMHCGSLDYVSMQGSKEDPGATGHLR